MYHPFYAMPHTGHAPKHATHTTHPNSSRCYMTGVDPTNGYMQVQRPVPLWRTGTRQLPQYRISAAPTASRRTESFNPSFPWSPCSPASSSPTPGPTRLPRPRLVGR